MLNIIGLSMFIIGLIGLCVSLLLIFLWRVPDIIDEISGRKAKRQIKKLRELNVGVGTASSVSTSDFYGLLQSGNLLYEINSNSTQNDSVVSTGSVEKSIVEVTIIEEQTSLNLNEEEY